jgi:hypothetical protein
MDRNILPMVLLGILAGTILTVVTLILLGTEQNPVVKFVVGNPTAAATMLAGSLGFAGVMLTTYLGFKNLIASNEHKAEKDEIARQRTIDHDKRVLAASLHAELSSLASQIKSARMGYEGMSSYCRTQLKESSNIEIQLPFSPTNFENPIYESQLNKLGLLGASIASDVVRTYSFVSYKAEFSGKYTFNQLIEIYEMASKRLESSARIIPVVQQRLAYLQGIWPDDPGSPYKNSPDTDS